MGRSEISSCCPHSSGESWRLPQSDLFTRKELIPISPHDQIEAQVEMDESKLKAREAFLNRRGVGTCHNPHKGTHLVALRPLSPGEIVLDSPPVAFAIGTGIRASLPTCMSSKFVISVVLCCMSSLSVGGTSLLNSAASSLFTAT